MKNKLITAGVDEVGRGCLAGPVVSAAVILKEGINLDLLKDSKKITFKRRIEISEHIATASLPVLLFLFFQKKRLKTN